MPDLALDPPSESAPNPEAPSFLQFLALAGADLQQQSTSSPTLSKDADPPKPDEEPPKKKIENEPILVLIDLRVVTPAPEPRPLRLALNPDPPSPGTPDRVTLGEATQATTQRVRFAKTEDPEPILEKNPAPVVSPAPTQDSETNPTAFTLDISTDEHPPAITKPQPVQPKSAEPSPAPSVAPPAPAAVETPADHAGQQQPGHDDRRQPRERDTAVKEIQQPDAPAPTPVLHEFAITNPTGTPATAMHPHVDRPQAPEPTASVARTEIPETPAAPKAGPLREIALSVPGREEAVNLHIVDDRGKLHVEVRTSDPQLASSLRDNVGDLVQKLDHSGYRVESTGSTQVAAGHQTKSGPEQDQAGGQGSRHPGQEQQQQQGQGRGNRPRWLEEIVRNFQVTEQEQETQSNGN